MKKHQILGLALFAAFAFSAVIAASASAEGGPVWIVQLCEAANPAGTGLWVERMSNGACLGFDGTAKSAWEKKLMVLAAGESEPIVSSGGIFKLDGITNIECLKLENSGEIIGGNPGTNLEKLEFLECFVEGLPNCLASTAGTVGADTIELEVKSMLVYPHEKGGTTGEALVAFFPDNNNTTENLFVEFTLLNASGSTECGLLLNGMKVDVSATGTLVEDPASILKKCGVLAVVGKLNSSNVFVKTVSGEEAVVGAVESSGTPLIATWWMPTEKVFLLMECKLEAFGAEATELGTSDVELTNGEEFGWEVA